MIEQGSTSEIVDGLTTGNPDQGRIEKAHVVGRDDQATFDSRKSFAIFHAIGVHHLGKNPGGSVTNPVPETH